MKLDEMITALEFSMSPLGFIGVEAADRSTGPLVSEGAILQFHP